MRAELDKQSTWELAEALARCTAAAERLRLSSWWDQYVLRAWRDRRLARLDTYEDHIVQTLEKRYRGIIHRVYMAVARETGAPDSAEVFQEFVADVWTSCIEEIGLENARLDFSRLLWDQLLSVCRETGAQTSLARVKRFKAMFMLRQFVDIMPDCEERGVLRTWIYQFAELHPQNMDEVLDMLDAAYKRLHATALLYVDELPQLTDGAMRVEDFQGQPDPGPLYERWLIMD